MEGCRYKLLNWIISCTVFSFIIISSWINKLFTSNHLRSDIIPFMLLDQHFQHAHLSPADLNFHLYPNGCVVPSSATLPQQLLQLSPETRCLFQRFNPNFPKNSNHKKARNGNPSNCPTWQSCSGRFCRCSGSTLFYSKLSIKANWSRWKVAK